MNSIQRKGTEIRTGFPFGVCLGLILCFAIACEAQTNSINLEAVLRLTKAQNLDVQIARARLAEAKAVNESARAQFFPWLSPGISYRRHDNLIQDVSGNIIEVHKQSYAPGVTLGAQLDIGDALFKSLVTKQQVEAAAHLTEAQRQASVFVASQNYFDLLFAQAAVRVAEEASRISTNYESQISRAVEAGLAFKGDQLRVRVQSANDQVAVHRARERQRLAAAQLAQTLHMDATVELIADDSELVPVAVTETNAALSALVQQALAARPEIKQSRATLAAATQEKKGAKFGPLIPSLGAQVFGGALGGDSDAGPSRFGEQEDVFAALSWKVGPGGLFDFSREHTAQAHLDTAKLFSAKTADQVAREVVDAAVRVQSLNEQLGSARQAVEAAEEGLHLTQLRKEFAVGIVLESIQAEQDLTRARADYLRTIAELDKAQYALRYALGKL
ncbi:MAG: Outer rane efflux protein [Verrucomicrobiales bacterium]|nr:Outer rane efflux protein [Verrucomicrobiales bacterium]